MGKKTPRTPSEYLLQENNRLLEGLSLGTVSVSANKGATSAPVSIAASATSIELLASNSDRVEGIIYNDSTSNLYVLMGSGATTSNYTIKLETDESLVIDRYTGVVHGVWDSAVGSAKVTDILP